MSLTPVAEGDAFVKRVTEQILRIRNLYDQVEKKYGAAPTLRNKSNEERIFGVEDESIWQPDALNPLYIHYYAVHTMHFKKTDIEDIAIKVISAMDAQDPTKRLYIDYILLMVETRLRVRLDGTFHSNINIISLGQDCLARLLPTKWGLKKPRAYGELSLPFDLSVTPLDSLIDILSTNFDEYLDDRYLDLSMRNDMCCIHTKYSIEWSHEVGEEWKKDNFRKLKERYNKRIANFYAVLKENKPSVFIFNTYWPYNDEFTEKALRLIDVLEGMGLGPMVFFYLIINNLEGKAAVSEFRLKQKRGRSQIYIYEISKPFPDYVWWKYEEYVSREGLKFDMDIAKALAEVLNQTSVTLTNQARILA